jgi:hypothetical protein
MKTIFGVAAILLTLFFVAGCSRKQNVATVKASEISVTAIAAGAKTKSGKPVDAYEVQLAQIPSVILILGGGKLETSSTALLALDGQMLSVDRQAMNNQVLILTKKRSGFIPIPNATPADAKAKCKPNSVIDLPIEETLAALPPMPGGQP